MVITADGGYRRGQAVGAQADRRRGASPRARRGAGAGGTPHRPGGRLGGRADLWWHETVRGGVDRAHRRAVRRRAPAVHPLHRGTTAQAQGHPAHHRRLPDPGRVHPPRGVRPQAGDRRLLVHRRHRLGHRAQLHRLRAAGQRRHPGHVRGHTGHPAPRPVLGARREVRVTILYTAPTAIRTIDEVGRRHPGEVRPVVAAPAGHGRRADQPRGLDVVPRAHRPATAARSSTPGGRPRPARS